MIAGDIMTKEDISTLVGQSHSCINKQLELNKIIKKNVKEKEPQYIWIVYEIKGDQYDEQQVNHLLAFKSETKAKEYKKEFNEKYSHLINIDDYVDAEVYLTNDLLNEIVVGQPWIEFVNSMLDEIKADNFTRLYWELILKEYYKYAEYNEDHSFAKFHHWLLYDKENHEQEFSNWFAMLMKVFCKSMKKYELTDIRLSIETYLNNWSAPKIKIKKLRLVD